MAYEIGASQKTPTCITVLIDLSPAMNRFFSPDSEGALEFSTACVLSTNRFIDEVNSRSYRATELRDNYELAVWGYNADRSGEVSCHALLSTNGRGGVYWPPTLLSSIARFPSGSERVDHVRPIWINNEEIRPQEFATPLRVVEAALIQWVNAHPYSFPPVVLHMTNATEVTTQIASLFTAVKGMRTRDGSALLFNVLLDRHSIAPLFFPSRGGTELGSHGG